MFFAPKMSLLKKRKKLIGFCSQESFYFFKDRLSKVIKCLKGYTKSRKKGCNFYVWNIFVYCEQRQFCNWKGNSALNGKEKREKLPEGYQTQQKHRPACILFDFVYQNIGCREKFLFLGRSFLNQDNKRSEGTPVTSATSKK